MADQPERSLYARVKAQGKRKNYIPLESDPEIFTELTRSLGVDGHEVHEVVSLDPDMIAFLPRPAVALIFNYPCDPFDLDQEEREKDMPVYKGKGEDEPVIWFAQTIQNACGLYALLHGLSNGIDKSKIRPGSPLDEFLKQAVPLAPEDRAQVLEASKGIETAHAAAGVKGGTRVPTDDEPVPYHYVCLVQSQKNGHVYHLDGVSKGPIDTGVKLADGEDMLSDPVLAIVWDFVSKAGGSVGFSLLSLSPSP